MYSFTACKNGSLLLFNGSHLSLNFTEGTVLVCYDNIYGAVCDDFWDELEARVVCKQFGLTSTGSQFRHCISATVRKLIFAGSIPVRNALFGEATNYPILLDQLMCTGNETSLLDCTAGEEIGSNNCDHSEDAGVRCEGGVEKIRDNILL